MPTPLNWITDRLPTEADADDDGDVIALSASGKGWYTTYWEGLHPGESWLPFTPPAINDAAVAVEAGKRRRIISITRTVQESGDHTIDAVADDGTAWWMIPGVTDGWTQLPTLPNRG